MSTYRGDDVMTFSKTLGFLAVLVLALVLIQPALAATWTVEKDGSGDFTIIQDALDAASPGDTILIGPGRYDTFQTGNLMLDGTPRATIARVSTTDLTIVGAGADQTILGPETSVLEHEGQRTSCITIDPVGFAEVRGVALQNTKYELDVFTQVLIEDCRIERTDGARSGEFAAWLGYSEGSVLRRLEMVNTGGMTTIYGITGLLVEDSYFEDLQERGGPAVHLGNGAQECVLRRCRIVGGGGGIQAGGGAVIEDCTLTGMRVFGLEAWGGGGVIAQRVHVGLTRIAVSVADGYLELSDSILEGGALITIQSSGDIYARGNHILNGGGSTVDSNARAAQGELIDLRFNWWGTSDPAQIQAWIVEYEAGSVIWDPFNDMPIPNEPESMSGLKSKFGRN
jgi:hypothetical protein